MSCLFLSDKNFVQIFKHFFPKLFQNGITAGSNNNNVIVEIVVRDGFWRVANIR